MKKVYVCSPYRSNIELNTKRAKQYGRAIIFEGKIPVIPHLLYTQFLDDEKDIERIIGLNIAIHLMLECDEIYVFSENNYISDGMKEEIKVWFKEKNIKPITILPYNWGEKYG